MKSRKDSDDCICLSCPLKHNKAYKGIERTGSKIDKLYRDKYLPLRESKLIVKLDRTRAVFDDVRAPFLADIKRNRNTNKKHKDSTEIVNCCSCCRCRRRIKNISEDSNVSSDYGHARQSSKRRVRFKPEFVRSEPCLCLAKFSSLLKRQSELVQSKIKRELSVPVLSSKIKDAATKQKSRVGKAFNNAQKKINAHAKSVICECQEISHKVSDSKAQLEAMLKLSVKNLRKSRMIGDMKHTNKYEGPMYRQNIDDRLCPCPQEKLVLKIRKDSIRKFYEDLEKKKTLKHLECKSECIEDICIPKECLDKIKLSKAKKPTKKQKTPKAPKQRKSLKQIVSKGSRRKKKKSVMCQCDDTSIPIKANDKHPSRVRQKKIKFGKSGKKGTKEKSRIKSSIITLDRPTSKSDGGNTLKRCFCTLKFKSKERVNTEPQKFSQKANLDYYPHSGQSGDMKKSSTQMQNTKKKMGKSKSSCTINDCDPNECLKDYYNRKRMAAPMARADKNMSGQSHIFNANNPDLSASHPDKRPVLRIGSSISFNIEFYKNVTNDTLRSVKTNTPKPPRILSNKSIKSIRSIKKMIKYKSRRKVTIVDNKLKENEGLSLRERAPSKILKKNKKDTKGKNKIKIAAKDIPPKDFTDDNKIISEMVDQSTKITNKDKRLLKPFECEPQTCSPDRCDPYLCLEKMNKYRKHVNINTELPKMISVASGVHERKLKHTRIQSKSSFERNTSFVKNNMYAYDDNKQIQSNALPEMTNRNSLRISSDFSFAIEIGRGLVPRINPMETIKRYSSHFKASKIKPRINNTQRTNKSKSSVINSMVKRCMCTLNLSKQRRRNKSHHTGNENFETKIYTVMTSNIGPFSAKRLPEKKLPRNISRIYHPTIKYKCNTNKIYAGCHSQIVCNYMRVSQRKNVWIRRQLKNNVLLISKSLSFLSDKKRIKKVDKNWTPCNYAARNSTTIFESSDYISKLYHAGECKTFTKSSKYWKKSYCTMNVKTFYNRNKSKTRGVNDSHNNCTRVGSNINLNIEFYKDNTCLESKHDFSPTTTTRKEQVLRNKTTQGLTSTYKEAYSMPEHQRCFCTLGLQGKHGAKQIHEAEVNPPANIYPAVSYVSRSQNTQKVKKIKKLPNESNTAEKVVNTPRSLMPEGQFYPRECIPGMCVPGQCDPAACYEILYKRKLKNRSISATTKRIKKKRAGVLTQQSSFRNARTQSQSIEKYMARSGRAHRRASSAYNNIDSGKQCVKIGSNISFNIEFFKENAPSIHGTRDNKVYDRVHTKPSKLYTNSSVNATTSRDFKSNKLSARPDSLLKRCFCTLKLQKKQKKPLLTEVHSVGVMAGAKNKWYSDRVLSNKMKMNDNDATGVYNTKSILKKHEQTLTSHRETKSKHGKQHIAMAALLPYECEPGTCTPGACNPYECLQRINARKLAKRDIGSTTTQRHKKSLGTSSKYGTPSKHRRIQTVAFKQNDMQISRVGPKKVRKNYDTAPSNNQCVRVGSSINFSIEFFKEKNGGTGPRRAFYNDTSVMNTSSPRYNKPMTNTRSVMSQITRRRKRTKHTLNRSEDPVVNLEMSSKNKKQTLSQLSQTRQKYFSKSKGLLPYECEPNVCVPGQCDPYECYERIQRRAYKDCSAVTVANVRDFASNPTPCYTCKSKRIQTGYRSREGAGIRFMKSVLDHKRRNYIRISSNFRFHIEVCKKGEAQERDRLLPEMQVRDDDYRYKRTHKRLHDQSSQSQYIRRRSQSTFAKSKLPRCFCTKNFFNSSTKARNLEYTTNCALVPNIIPIGNNNNNINSNRDSQHYINNPSLSIRPRKCAESVRYLKNNVKPKRFLKFRHNASKLLNNKKIKSYLSFDLEMYKRKNIKSDIHKICQKQISSDQHINIPEQKSDVNKFKWLKTIDSKSIQGQGDSDKTVVLKKCCSTINFTKNDEINVNTGNNERDLQVSRYETIHEVLKTKEVCLKYMFTDSNRPETFDLPRAKILRWDEVNENLFNSNNMRFLCNTYTIKNVVSIKNNFIEIKKYNNQNYNGDREKCNYFRNIYDKLHPYVNKLNLKQLFKTMKSRRSDKNTDTMR